MLRSIYTVCTVLWWVGDGDASKKHISNLFGLFWFCCVLFSSCWASKWRPGSTCSWRMRSSPFRAALRSVCEACRRDLRLALTRFGSVDRLGWQQGDQLVCLRCQQHLTLPTQFVTAPNSMATNTWEKPANALQSYWHCCVRDVSCFFNLIEFVCLFNLFSVHETIPFYFSVKLPFFLFLSWTLPTFTGSLCSSPPPSPHALVSPPPTSSASIFLSQWKIFPLHYLWRVAALCSCQMQQTRVLFLWALTCAEFQADSCFICWESQRPCQRACECNFSQLSLCVTSQQNAWQKEVQDSCIRMWY